MYICDYFAHELRHIYIPCLPVHVLRNELNIFYERKQTNEAQIQCNMVKNHVYLIAQQKTSLPLTNVERHVCHFHSTSSLYILNKQHLNSTNISYSTIRTRLFTLHLLIQVVNMLQCCYIPYLKTV